MRTLLCDDCTNSVFCGVIDPNEFFPIFWKFHCKKKNFTCLLLDGFLFFFASQIKLPHLRTLVLHNPCFSLFDCVRHPVKCSSPSVRAECRSSWLFGSQTVFGLLYSPVHFNSSRALPYAPRRVRYVLVVLSEE